MITAVDVKRVQDAHELAIQEARQAAQAFADRYMDGQDGGPCGFAWVDIYRVRKNSKLGKALATVGFRKSISGSLQLWNGRAGWWAGQSVDAAGHGAYAYAQVMKEQLGLDFYACSRLD